jgi:hypothetical protein
VVGLSLLSGIAGELISRPIRWTALAGTAAHRRPQSRQRLLVDLARRDGLSIRQLYLKIAGARGHQQIVARRKPRRPAAAMV